MIAQATLGEVGRGRRPGGLSDVHGEAISVSWRAVLSKMTNALKSMTRSFVGNGEPFDCRSSAVAPVGLIIESENISVARRVPPT